MPRTVVTSPRVRTPRRPFANLVRAASSISVGQRPVDAEGNTAGAGGARGR